MRDGTKPTVSSDESIALLNDPYGFIGSRARGTGRDVFTTRLLGRPVTCLTGAAAARFFYDEDHVIRSGAAPGRVLDTLFGHGGVQGLDGEEHRNRKAMLMSLMTPNALDRLESGFEQLWRTRAHLWQGGGQVTLFREVNQMLCQAACDWAGVPVSDLHTVTELMMAMIDGPAAIGPRYRRGRQAREDAERWASDLIEGERARAAPTEDGSPLQVIAHWTGADGQLVARHDAAVDLLNIIRPTVAVGRYIVWSAATLHSHPAERDRIRERRDDTAVDRFAHEVRRQVRFFPMVPGIARGELTWNGEPIPHGRWLLLDLHGTNHDPDVWSEPETFCPQRFAGWEIDPFALIPQGGGDHDGTQSSGHRCAGEWATIRLMGVSVRMLVDEMTYTVPPQDLRVPARRAPTLPRSGFVLDQVALSGGHR